MVITTLMAAGLMTTPRHVSAQPQPQPRITHTIQVGDCVATASALEEYNGYEEWEDKLSLEYSKILANGKKAYKTMKYYNGVGNKPHQYVSKILYKNVYHYIKIECLK